MILEACRDPRAVLEFGIPREVAGLEPPWVACLAAGRWADVQVGRLVHTASSLCSLPMAFSLCILVQSRLSAVRPLPRIPFWL